jgi:beta-carotene 3-hydroxylase
VLADVVLVVAALVVMEPLTYLAHRFVMHGFGMGWHRSHHRRRDRALEANDLFPVVFAGFTIAVMAAGVAITGLHTLVPITIGVSLYGAGYLFVHELYIHRRWARFRARLPVLERLADAHALHHRFGGEPFGFLVPIVPASVRDRAAGIGSGRSRIPSGRDRDGRPLDRSAVLANRVAPEPAPALPDRATPV